MSSTMELDEESWRFLKDDSGHVARAAEAALRSMGWNETVLWTQVAEGRGNGTEKAECIQVWCVKLSGVDPEIRVCISATEFSNHARIVPKFAAAFEVFRPPTGL